MERGEPAGPVLVAVEEPAHVQQLVRTAGDLARLAGKTVRLVTVVVKSYDSPFGVFDDETIVRQFSGDDRELLARAEAPPGVTVERDLIVARSVARGLLAAVDETDPAALVVGWEGRPRRSDAVLGSTVDRLVERAACDLYVERVGAEANGVDAVLLPVAGGPHVAAAAAVVKAIAARNEARVVLLSVATPGPDAGDAREVAGRYVEEAAAALDRAPGPAVPVERVVRVDDDVVGTIVDVAYDGDVIVLGATRQGRLRRRLVGSVPRRLVGETDRTVILARDGDVVGGPLGRVGELLRR
ncbi:universal stress protein [Halobium salinum]|uniref:Universal stress protein n=1 Tax=Halobium salinum TaxID=1364940 RepID=A0ABD5PG49_9EURY|nr:universal stress protein [Halobium salinum]